MCLKERSAPRYVLMTGESFTEAFGEVTEAGGEVGAAAAVASRTSGRATVFSRDLIFIAYSLPKIIRSQILQSFLISKVTILLNRHLA
jgi:hypothetical protein